MRSNNGRGDLEQRGELEGGWRANRGKREFSAPSCFGMKQSASAKSSPQLTIVPSSFLSMIKLTMLEMSVLRIYIPHADKPLTIQPHKFIEFATGGSDVSSTIWLR